MEKFRRYTNSIEAFLHSDNGQRFFNIAYSVGAAIVIWGALFKILHLPGGNTLLCIGMGTEIAMFILTAFDRPPKEPNWEEIVPALSGKSGNGELQSEAQPVEAVTIVDDAGNPEDYVSSTKSMVSATDNLSKASELAEATNRFVEAIEGISQQMSQLNEAMSSGSNGYAEHMANLNRNLSGLNTIYEIQLRSVSGQLEAIERVNKGLKEIRDMYEKSAADSEKYCEETEKMARYMKQLNEVYARMISAMTLGGAHHHNGSVMTEAEVNPTMANQPQL
ncbi:MAG: gliding motility protein GldL [Muribaculaceae bacterium]|nr:gliding motility protein GldL [Muribaculaceae bacterium]